MAISSIIDECVDVNFIILSLENFYPIILNVDFFNPAFENDTVLVKIELIKLGKTIIHFNAVVTNQNNSKLVARASSNLAVG